jgi:hypothetical protein
MQTLLIKAVHPDIEFVSDRTLRDFLKRLSKVVRKAQIDEVKHLINDDRLSNRAQAAALNYLKNDFETLPVYYLERIERGSWETLVTVTADILGELAIKVIEKITVNAAVKNALFRKFEKYLTDDRPETLGEAILSALKPYIEDGTNFTGHISLSQIDMILVDGQPVLHIALATDMREEFRDVMTAEKVVELLREKIRQTDPKD